MPDDGTAPMGTLGMVANLFGLGPIMETVNSPDFQEHIRQIVTAILTTNQRCERIEHRLAILCRSLGIADDSGPVEYLGHALVPVEQRAAGTGGAAAASGTPDHGTGAPATSPELAVAPGVSGELGAALASYADATGHEFDLTAWMTGQAGSGVPGDG